MITHLKILLILLGGPAFLIGTVGYLTVRLKLRPGDKEMEETYYEFEDQHPAFHRYETWSRITLGLIILSMLCMFLTIAL